MENGKLSNSLKLLLVGVVVAAVAAGVVFVILPDAEEAQGPDATLSAPESVRAVPSFESNLVDDRVAAVEAIEEIPAEMPEVDAGAAALADRSTRKAERQGRDVEITGRVLDGAGRPVEGATVSYVREPMAMMAMTRFGSEDGPSDLLVEAVTDRDGRFSLNGRARKESNNAGGGIFSLGRVSQLIVQHDSFATLIYDCSTLEPGVWNAGDLILEPGAWIVGRIVDGSGRAIAGAAVAASSAGDGGGRRGMRVFGMSVFGGGLAQQLDAVESGPDGRFMLRGLVPGIAHVTASKSGLRLATVEDVKLEARVPANVGDIVLEQGVSISGVVLNEDGDPLVGATVSVSSMARLMISRIEDLPRGQIGQEMGQRAKTDDLGRFELGGLVGGNYNVHASADGYATHTEADVPAGTRNIRMQPEKLGGLLVTVISARDGKPVLGATIGASSSGGRGRWGRGMSSPVLEGNEALAAAERNGDPEGVYLVQYAGLENTQLTVAAEGFGTLQADGPAVASGSVGAMTIELLPESVVAGLVLDAEGNPIARARVTMRSVEPNQGGSFQFGRGGMRMMHEISISVGGDDDETPPNAERLRARTGYDGSFEIRGATAGEWELTANADGFAPSTAITLTLAEGQEQRDVDVELVRAGSIAGYVTEVDGTPVDDVRVVVEARTNDAAPTDQFGRMERQMARMFGGGGGDNGPWHARTDAEGRYEVNGLAPGEYEVELDSGPGGRGMRGMMIFMGDDAAEDETPAAWTTVVEGVESRVDLVRPKRSVVRGRVTAGGQPAADVTVRLRTDSPFAFGGEGAQTDAYGLYEFTDVEAGDYVVTSIVPGAAIEEKVSLKIGEGETVSADLVFGGATLSGRVVDKTSGFGVPGVTLTAALTRGDSGGGGDGPTMRFDFSIVTQGIGGGGSGMTIDVGGGSVSKVKTDPSGNFELKYLKPGKYLVEAVGGGYTTASIGPFDVSDGEDKDDLLIEVQRGAIVKGLVHSGETGGRLDKVPVRLRGGDIREMTVTNDGAYTFEGLEPGEYTIEVLGSGWGADAIATEDITLEEGEVRSLDLVTEV